MKNRNDDIFVVPPSTMQISIGVQAGSDLQPGDAVMLDDDGNAVRAKPGDAALGFIESLQLPDIEASASLNDYLRTKAGEQGIMRMVLPPTFVAAELEQPEAPVVESKDERPVRIKRKPPIQLPLFPGISPPG